MKKVTPELLQNELTVNAGVFAKKKDVTVVFAGEMAGTDGSNIVLPTLPEEHEMSEDCVNVARGYVNHEAGHIVHTDFDAMNRMKEECKRDGNKSLPMLHNALEDIWLEKRVNAEYAGSMDTIAATAKSVNKAFLERHAEWSDEERKQQLSEEGVGAVALTWEGRKNYGDDTLCQECLDLLPDEVRSKLPARIAALDHCNNTQDVIDLARLIDTEIKEEAEKKREEKRRAKGGGDEGECAKATVGNAEGEGSDKEDSTSGSSSELNQKAEVYDDTVKEIPAGAEDGGGGYGKGATSTAEAKEVEKVVDVEQYDPNMSVGLKHMIKEDEREATSKTVTSGWKPWSTKYDAVIESTHPWLDGSPNVYKKLVKEMSGKVNAMQRKLEAGLSAKLDVDWETEKLQGRLDTRRLVNAFNCKPDVYKTRAPAPDMDTAVTLLVDMSGSMSGHRRGRKRKKTKIELAREVCIALLETCERLGTATEVVGFTQYGLTSQIMQPDRSYRTMSEEEYIDMRGIGKSYDRTGPLCHFIFKGYNQRLSDTRHTFSQMTVQRMWQNADGDSIDFARRRLERRSERRKIMMVLSDGWPAADGDGDDRQHLRDAVERCSKADIDTIGIGINSDAVGHFYPRYAVCTKIEDLPNSVCSEIGKLLIDDRYKASNADLMKASSRAA